MEASPLVPDILFHIGFVPISRSVVTTWAIMALLFVVLRVSLRAPKVNAGPTQAALEVVVLAIADQLQQVLNRDPWPYMPLLGSLFIFLGLANLAAVVPGATPPTGHLETPAALAVIVLLSVHYFGIRTRGARKYFGHYLEPNPFLLPLNILGDLTRTFSLMIRLFGNMMSHEFVIAIVVFLAGLIVPVPFLLLGVLIGIIQAYIFTILATVYIGGAVGAVET